VLQTNTHLFAGAKASLPGKFLQIPKAAMHNYIINVLYSVGIAPLINLELAAGKLVFSEFDRS
jgi:hypothetical protein